MEIRNLTLWGPGLNLALAVINCDLSQVPLNKFPHLQNEYYDDYEESGNFHMGFVYVWGLKKLIPENS